MKALVSSKKEGHLGENLERIKRNTMLLINSILKKLSYTTPKQENYQKGKS